MTHIISAENTVFVTAPDINACQGLEYSLAALCSIVMKLVPNLKAYHFRHIFKIIGPLHFADILSWFMKSYNGLPHMVYQHSVLSAKSMRLKVPVWKGHPLYLQFVDLVICLQSRIKHMLLKRRKELKLLKRLCAELKSFDQIVYLPPAIQRDGFGWNMFPCTDNSDRLVDKYCSFCNRREPQHSAVQFKTCSMCQLTAYCGRPCQKKDWNLNGHKIVCNKLHRVRLNL